MKKLLLLAGALLSLNAAQAQYYYMPAANGNPGGLNTDPEYPVGGGLPTSWTTLLTGTSAMTATPAWSNNATIPFPFQFNGTAVTSYKASTSGVLTFTTSATAVPPSANVALPSTDIPDNSVAVWGMHAAAVAPTAQNPSGASDFIVHKTFGTAPNRQHWVQFNSFSQNGNPNSGYTYWSIVLEETTNNIYVVDQRSGGVGMTLTVGIQVNGTTAVQVAGSPNLSSQTLATSDPTPADNKYYTFIHGTQPNYDMGVTAVNVPTYLILANAPYNITGVIQNFGALPVTSFTLNYAINGGTPVSVPVTANIAPLGTFGLSHATTWNPSVTGNYTITAWATDINGSNADLNTANDVGSKMVSVLSQTTPRTVLHEMFTSATCGPCLLGNTTLRNVNNANPGKAIDIKYQQNFPGAGNDPYQTPDSIARRANYYGINSIPRLEVDGGWDTNSQLYNSSVLNNAYNKPAIMTITGTHTLVGHTITAQAVINPIGNNIPNNNLVAHMVITENRTVNNRRTNGETEFFDVMKTMLPNENGTPIAGLTAGNNVTINQTYTFPYPPQVLAGGLFPDSVENFNNLDVTIFVQDKVTKEVFQAARSVWTNAPNGISDNSLASKVNLYPNPSTGRDIKLDVNLENAENVQITVMNASGQVVSSSSKGKLASGNNTLTLDLNGQTKGIYIVKVLIGDKMVTKTLSLTL